jgi:hypothetical protein
MQDGSGQKKRRKDFLRRSIHSAKVHGKSQMAEKRGDAVGEFTPSHPLRFFSGMGSINNFILYNQQSPTFLQERRFLLTPIIAHAASLFPRLIRGSLLTPRRDFAGVFPRPLIRAKPREKPPCKHLN